MCVLYIHTYVCMLCVHTYGTFHNKVNDIAWSVKWLTRVYQLTDQYPSSIWSALQWCWPLCIHCKCSSPVPNERYTHVDSFLLQYISKDLYRCLFYCTTPFKNPLISGSQSTLFLKVLCIPGLRRTLESHIPPTYKQCDLLFLEYQQSRGKFSLSKYADEHWLAQIIFNVFEYTIF
jgi:hypothetical protein